MDDIDRAQAINEQFLEKVLDDHQRNMPKGESLTHCEDCEEEIPEARRQAVPGCLRCIGCQNDHEKLLSHWRAL